MCWLHHPFPTNQACQPFTQAPCQTITRASPSGLSHQERNEAQSAATTQEHICLASELGRLPTVMNCKAAEKKKNTSVHNDVTSQSVTPSLAGFVLPLADPVARRRSNASPWDHGTSSHDEHYQTMSCTLWGKAQNGRWWMPPTFWKCPMLSLGSSAVLWSFVDACSRRCSTRRCCSNHWAGMYHSSNVVCWQLQQCNSHLMQPLIFGRRNLGHLLRGLFLVPNFCN